MPIQKINDQSTQQTSKDASKNRNYNHKLDKWTLHILSQIRNGVTRPGQLTRSTEGLTTKVLNERLAKLLRFGILQKTSYPDVPPRVEYQLTEFGNKFSRILDEVDRLQAEL